METEQHSASRDPIAAPSHIIERPRLIKLMEESGARVIVLHAPAGYGKTTLARQWLSRQEEPVAWYRCSPSSSDVAVVVHGLADAMRSVLPIAGARALERLRDSAKPDEETSLLAELLASDLADWPSGAWLVIDDYHYLEEAPAVASFSEQVLRAEGPRILVTSRRRPTWATARRIVYGEILEIDRQSLTMSETEAVQVLGGHAQTLRVLIEQARGWPAVIGLAALAPEVAIPQADLPTTLYDYFAEELYQASTSAEQLSELALLPVLNEHLARTVLGADADRVVNEAFRLGIIADSPEGEPEIHPLLLTFLRRRLASSPEGREAASRVAELLVDSGEWEGAFSIVESFTLPELIPKVVAGGLDESLAEGRLASLIRWLTYAEDHLVHHPVLDLAAAEIAFREGLYRRSEALATRAAEELSDDPPLRTAALIRASQAALQANRLEASYELANAAVTSAVTPHELREARIGQLFAALELERDETLELAGRLDQRLDTSSDGELRMANARLVVASRIGGLESAVAQGEAVMHLASASASPIARGSFLSSLAHVLALTSRYRQALDVAAKEIEVATTYRLDFARYHGLTANAIAQLGMGETAKASRTIRQIRAYGEELEDPYFHFYAIALEARRLVICGDADAAVRLTRARPDVDVSPSLRGEYLGYRALSLACVGDHEAADDAAAAAESASRWGIEARVLAAGARSIGRLDQPTNEAITKLMQLVEVTGNSDSLVSICLGHPRFAEIALETPSRHRMTMIFTRSRNPRLVRHVPAEERIVPIDQRSVLTPRERDVHALLITGLTNRQIAEALFLSEKTVKVHVRHIYDKLGVRSRIAVALQDRTDEI